MASAPKKRAASKDTESVARRKRILEMERKLKQAEAKNKKLLDKTSKLEKAVGESKSSTSSKANTPKSRPAVDVEKSSARGKFLEDAKSGKIRAGSRAKFLSEAKAGNIKAKAPIGGGSSVARSLVKGVLKRAIPVIGFMADASPAQAPAPAQGEKLMRGMPSIGFGGPTSSAAYGYKKQAKKNIVGNNPNRGLADRKAKAMGTGAAPPNGPPSGKMKSSKAAEFKKKNLDANQKAGKVTPQAPVSAAPKPKARPQPAFKGNWTGAAATEMQKRGGRKIKRPNLLSLFKKK
jgi:hypothetical protein